MDDNLFSGQKQLAMERALRLLSMRWHTAKELADKLKKNNFPLPVIRETIAECERLGLLNDQQYARDYSSLLANRGCGAFRIKLNLRQKGIDAETSEEILDALATGEPERALEAATFKLKSLTRETDFRKKREKVCRFLAGRGFKSDSIWYAVERLPELNGQFRDE